MKNFLLALTLTAAAASAQAQSACHPCIPLTTQWTARAAETWNVAAAALVLANGDPNTIVLPTGSERYKWVILQRITGDAFADSTPFSIETFDQNAPAIARLESVGRERTPVLLTTPDGRTLLLYLKDPERRLRASQR